VTRAAWAATILAATIASGAHYGCSDRDHTNLFDPENPGTLGTPSVLRVLGGDRSATLFWDVGPIRDLRAVRAVRVARDGGVGGSSGSDSDSVLVLPTDRVGEFRDAPLINEIAYVYRLEILDPRGRWLSSQADTTEPSATTVWASGGGGCGLASLTADGRDVISRGFVDGELLDVALDVGGAVWAADYFFGEILRVGGDGSLLDRIEQPAVNALAVDASSGRLWAASFPFEAIVLYDAQGRVAWADSTIGLVEAIAPSVGRPGVWTCARDGSVCRVESGAVAQRFEGFAWPVAIAPGGVDQPVWIAERGAVTPAGVARLDPATGAVVRFTNGLVAPRDVVLDGQGGVWVADPGREGIVRLDAAGAAVEFLPLGPVDSVTHDPLRGDLWVASTSEGWIRRVRLEAQSPPRLQVGGRPGRVVIG